MAKKSWSRGDFIIEKEKKKWSLEREKGQRRRAKIDFLIGLKFSDYSIDRQEIEDIIREAELNTFRVTSDEDETARDDLRRAHRRDERWREAVEKAILKRSEEEIAAYVAEDEIEDDADDLEFVRRQYELLIEEWKFEGKLLKLSDEELSSLYFQEKKRVEDENSLESMSVLRHEIESLRQEIARLKPIAEAKAKSKRERENLLKLLLVVAVKHYSYNPRSIHSSSPAAICNDAADVGTYDSSESIREKLKEAFSLLKSGEKEVLMKGLEGSPKDE